jgi:hypothetical protein
LTRALPLLAKIGGSLAFALILGLGLLYVRLLHGPISLGFLVSPIEAAISEEFAGLNVHIEDVGLNLTGSGRLQFELKNIRVASEAGEPLAITPTAAISLSRKALLRGRIVPERVDLISPRVLLFYTDEGRISLRFSPAPDHNEGNGLRGPIEAAPPSPAGPAVPAAADPNRSLGRIDLVKMLSEASARARRRDHAGYYLRELGMRAAIVIIDNDGHKSIWRMPELNIDLDHRRSRSSIAGRAKIESLSGPWDLDFRTYEVENAKTLKLAVSVQGLVPRGLSRALPQLAGLESLDLPMWLEAKLDLSNAGDILGGTIGIDAAPGQVYLPGGKPMHVEGGHIAVSYSSTTQRFEITPSSFGWGDSRVEFTGSVVHAAQGPEGPGWMFQVKSTGGWIGAEPPLLPRLPIDQWSVRGFLAPERGRIVLNQFLLRAGGTEVSAEGDVAGMGSPALKGRLEGRIGAMPVNIFKTLWPHALAPGTRAWLAQRLTAGTLKGGAFKLLSGSGVSGTDWAPSEESNRVSLTLEGANVQLALARGLPALEAPRVLVRLEGKALEVTAPDASFAGANGHRLGVKGTFSVDLNQPMPRTGHLALRTQGPLPVVLDLLDREPLRVLHKSGFVLGNVDGRLEGQVEVELPLADEIDPAAVKVEGRLRVIDGKASQAIGPYDVQNANFAIDLTPPAVEVKGDLKVKGVLAKADWKHVYGAPAGQQPPLVIAAQLGDQDRTQLGLDINDIVRGRVDLEIIATPTATGKQQVHVRAGLADAELSLDSIAWRKPKGRPSVFEFDVVKGTTYPTELHNVSLVGENVAIEGWMGVGADHRVREFRFPQFTLNTVSRLKAQGKMGPGDIWDVTAEGPTFDARDLFRSFFVDQHEKPLKVKPGLNLHAEIGTALGYSDSSLQKVRMSFQKRADKMVALDVRGTLDGGEQFAAALRPESGQPRLLRAEATDAGKLFKLVGFYPNAFGGTMKLEVNLDGEGAAERTGNMWVKKFYVLGDPIFDEVLQNAGSQGGKAQVKNITRERFDFDTMRVPFSVGHGQFVMNNARLDGPIISITMRGSVDVAAEVLDVGGGFTPMAGLQKIIPPIPLLTPRGEGMFAITYAIKGSLRKPQVSVNPFALFTPGITREFMQMAPDNPRVQPREKPPARRGSASRPSAAAPRGAGDRGAAVEPSVGGDWSATSDSGIVRK